MENLLFNNIDQTLSLFGAPGCRGVRFEDLGQQVPCDPDDARRSSFYRYGLVEPGGPSAAVGAEHVLYRLPEAVVPEGPARLSARIWLAVRSARPLLAGDPRVRDESYMLRISVRGLHPPKNLKAIVDGASAAMQRDNPDRVELAMARLSLLTDVDAEKLVALVSAPAARQDPAPARMTGSNSRPELTDLLYVGQLLILGG